MSKLQNDFTTPEQSKRLLELGVPEWTADCYNTTKHIGKIPESATYKDVWKMSKWRDKNGNHIEMYPCWSVGRLMEIIKICSNLDTVLGYQIAYNTKHKTSLLHIVIQIIEDGINEFDFSKLEE
jgi:hypothetical protein